MNHELHQQVFCWSMCQKKHQNTGRYDWFVVLNSKSWCRSSRVSSLNYFRCGSLPTCGSMVSPLLPPLVLCCPPQVTFNIPVIDLLHTISQPPFKQIVVPLDDDKPLLGKMVVRKPTYKKWGLSLPGVYIYTYVYIQIHMKFLARGRGSDSPSEGWRRFFMAFGAPTALWTDKKQVQIYKYKWRDVCEVGKPIKSRIKNSLQGAEPLAQVRQKKIWETRNHWLEGGVFLVSPRTLGKRNPFWHFIIFFKGVGSTN